MTQPSLSFGRDAAPVSTHLHVTLCDKLAAHLRAHPGEWIDGRELATIAGAYAWRTRTSDLRRAPYFMAIENGWRQFAATKHVKAYRVSEYRWVP